MKKIGLYMLVMSGQGDIYITLVDKETWDWVFHPHSKIPENVLKACRESHEDKEYTPYISKGSAVNDAALAVAGYKLGSKRAEFSDLSPAIRYIQKHNIKIVESWNGFIY